MVEIDIDFDYCGEVEMILAHDEYKEHEDVEFYRADLIKSENAQLRQLVYNIHEALRTDKTGMFHELILISMEDDMRKLGIKVD